jgi:hypothetical protein
MRYRIDKHGTIQPIIHRHVSGHASYKIAVRTAKRRHERTGIPMGVVTWHDEKYVVMPERHAAGFEVEELLVEYH